MRPPCDCDFHEAFKVLHDELRRIVGEGRFTTEETLIISLNLGKLDTLYRNEATEVQRLRERWLPAPLPGNS